MGKRTRWGHCKATGKRKYYTEHDVKGALRSASKVRDKNRRRDRVRRECRYYKCPDCDGWHLTSQE